MKLFRKQNLCCLLILSVILFTPMLGYADFDANDHMLAIKEERYGDALKILNRKKESKRTVLDKQMIQSLDVVIKVEKYKRPRNSIAMTEDEVEPDVLSKVKKYLKAAKQKYLNNQLTVSKHILIHLLYIYPDYPKGVYFLTEGFSMSPGTYKVDDQVKKLIKRSDNYFYGGNYLKAVEDLSVLVILERDNSVVYEKLGSAYYMMNEKQKAVDQWVTALFFNPDNQKLEEMVTSTKKIIISEATEESVIDKARESKVVIKDPQVMGVFKRQSEAFDLMKSLRDQGLAVAIIENDSGKWVVQVSREELQKKNEEKKANEEKKNKEKNQDTKEGV